MTLPYDEFGLFDQNLSEWGLDVPVPPVRRFFISVDGLRQVSGLVWGEGEPELVLLHGGAQNAHTFDTVALTLQRPLVAIDLPSHGHSDPSPYPHAAIAAHARDIAVVMDELTTRPVPLIGMSLGGLVAIEVLAQRPDVVSHLVLLDITPTIDNHKAKAILDFVNGPATFPDFEALVARTVAHHPQRSESALRRGILHNALQRSDGSWVWRHQRSSEGHLAAPEAHALWDVLGASATPLTLIYGQARGSMVNTQDIEQLTRLRPDATIIGVEGAGHSIQGDQPVVLAQLLREL